MSKNRVALRRSLSEAVKIDQGMLRYVLDQSRDCIKILDPKGHVTYVNSEGRCALHITDVKAVYGKHWSDLWPQESRSTIDAAIDHARLGQSSEIEAWRPDGGGERSWWRISVSPLMEGDGDLAGILTMSRDITPHVTLRESEQTLALEMRHRLRNAYTIASAIVMQSARNDPAAQTFAEAVCARLADVALSQTRLLEAGEKAWPLSELIRTLVEAHGEGAMGIRYAGSADASVDGHEAMLVALVVGELTNNSLKYGALRRGTPAVLSWTTDRGSLTLHWREPLEERHNGSLHARDSGSGYSMMERVARGQRASFEHCVSNGRLEVTLKLPGRVRA
ncbi:MAG: PAS domain-containing protein [Pseudomonadota bacterium]